MKAKSAAAVVGLAAMMIFGLSATAHANQPGNQPPGSRFVGTYPTEKDCFFAAAEEIGRDPAHRNYSCGLTPHVRWALYVW